MPLHIYNYGFQFDYVVWDKHGEFRESISTDMEVETFLERGFSSLVHPMIDMVFETIGHNQNALGIPNTNAQTFYKSLQQVKEFIWNGCEVTTLTVMLKLMNILKTYGILEVGFT